MKSNFPSPLQKANAHRMRKLPTEAEYKLWKILRNRRFIDYKFRRQVPIGPYIADFVCFSKKIIIEADGSQHVENEKDKIRDSWFEAHGLRIIRFWNNDIMYNSEGVMEKIWHELHQE